MMKYKSGIMTDSFTMLFSVASQQVARLIIFSTCRMEEVMTLCGRLIKVFMRNNAMGKDYEPHQKHGITFYPDRSSQNL